MNYIKAAFNTLGVVIDRTRIRQMQQTELQFRLRGTNILVLNGMMLGVDPIAFKTQDRSALFHIFGVEERTVANLIKTIPTIDRSFNVESDPFNLFAFWVMHQACLYIEDKRIRLEFMKSVCRYYHYKIFTSVVNRSFQHGANPGIMQAVVNRLTRKSDIVRYESWGGVIDEHVNKLIDPDGSRYKTIQLAAPDEEFKLLITGSQTALRNKLVTFAREYYEAYEDGISIGTSSIVAENADGEKIIAQEASVIDSVMAEMVSDVLTLNTWLDDQDITLVANLFSAITPHMLRAVLTCFSEEAVHQMSARTFDKVVTKGQTTLYVGIRALLFEIVRSSLRFCRYKNINPAKKASCVDALRSVYASSRNQDRDILDVKESVTALIAKMRVDYNETATSALRLALVQYIILRMYRKM